jgi:hypothetical protein
MRGGLESNRKSCPLRQGTGRRPQRSCEPDDFAARNVAGAIIGVIMASTLGTADQGPADMFGRIDAALAHLEGGLPL